MERQGMPKAVFVSMAILGLIVIPWFPLVGRGQHYVRRPLQVSSWDPFTNEEGSTCNHDRFYVRDNHRYVLLSSRSCFV